MGLANGRFAYATAVDVVQSVISVTLILVSNTMAKKITGEGIGLVMLIWFLMFMFLTVCYRYFNREYVDRIAVRLQTLERNMQNLLHEEFTKISSDHVEEDDELDYVIDYYNHLLEKAQALFRSRIRDEQEKRRLELELIQAQINPHFLYNTLDMIKWKALDVHADAISDIIYKLSDFYRISLNSGEELIRLREEIQHARDYLDLQQLRFEASIQLEIEMPEELLDYRIPKITLQPLIENSIQHGFLAAGEREDCLIEIYGWKEGDTVVLMVRDNGAGMSEEQVHALLSGENCGEKHSYGARNVHERIRLYCGEEYGLTCESKPGEGTTIMIRFRAEGEAE